MGLRMSGLSMADRLIERRVTPRRRRNETSQLGRPRRQSAQGERRLCRRISHRRLRRLLALLTRSASLDLVVAGVPLVVHRHVRPRRARPVAAGGRRPDVPALQLVRTRDAGLDHERSWTASTLWRRPGPSSPELVRPHDSHDGVVTGTGGRIDRGIRGASGLVSVRPPPSSAFGSQPSAEHVGAHIEVLDHDVLVDAVQSGAARSKQHRRNAGGAEQRRVRPEAHAGHRHVPARGRRQSAQAGGQRVVGVDAVRRPRQQQRDVGAERRDRTCPAASRIARLPTARCRAARRAACGARPAASSAPGRCSTPCRRRCGRRAASRCPSRGCGGRDCRSRSSDSSRASTRPISSTASMPSAGRLPCAARPCVTTSTHEKPLCVIATAMPVGSGNHGLVGHPSPRERLGAKARVLFVGHRGDDDASGAACAARAAIARRRRSSPPGRPSCPARRGRRDVRRAGPAKTAPSCRRRRRCPCDRRACASAPARRHRRRRRRWAGPAPPPAPRRRSRPAADTSASQSAIAASPAAPGTSDGFTESMATSSRVSASGSITRICLDYAEDLSADSADFADFIAARPTRHR